MRGRGLPVRPRMNASRRGSGSSVRNVPPPIATIWPFTSGQASLTSGAGLQQVRHHGALAPRQPADQEPHPRHHHLLRRRDADRLHDQGQRDHRDQDGHGTAAPPAATPLTPAATAAPAPTPREYRLTLLHNNDGESKYVVGDSIANYGGITRFKTVLDRARTEAATDRVSAGVEKGTVTISSGDNFL